MFRNWVGMMGSPVLKAFGEARALSGREAGFLISEAAQFRSLLPLLTRTREDRKWSELERAELNGHLRRISTLSPYLVLVLLPGSFLAIPLLAWWRDRRRNRVLVCAPACGAPKRLA